MRYELLYYLFLLYLLTFLFIYNNYLICQFDKTKNKSELRFSSSFFIAINPFSSIIP